MRTLPHVAVIERSEPFLPADTDTLDEQCRRITNGQEFHHVSAGSMIATPVSWAMREHFHWFFNWRKPISAVTESADDHPPPTAYPHSEE